MKRLSSALLIFSHYTLMRINTTITFNITTTTITTRALLAWLLRLLIHNMKAIHVYKIVALYLTNHIFSGECTLSLILSVLTVMMCKPPKYMCKMSNVHKKQILSNTKINTWTCKQIKTLHKLLTLTAKCLCKIASLAVIGVHLRMTHAVYEIKQQVTWPC